MKFNVALVPGDGIGPDIVREAVNALDAVGRKFGHEFKYQTLLAGGAAIDKAGQPLPDETLPACREADAVLLGAVGGPKWDNVPGDKRPEKALLGLRSGLGLYANLRPAILYPELADACPLKPRLVEGGLDVLAVRELTGGLYFGAKGHTETSTGESAYDTMVYSDFEVERVAVRAFESARLRKKHVTSVDKANILETSRLWRRTVERVAKGYPDVALDHLYVDNAAMQLVLRPRQFDVILSENTFGDILSDLASCITGSIGMLPSASLGTGSFGLYEPIHGSAPDIAGKDLANPIATVLSAAMMLRHSFALEAEARAVESAVKTVLAAGWRTGDIMGAGMKKVGTQEMGRLISEAIAKE
jgi:3-isopropylmalate dehydrogenase